MKRIITGLILMGVGGGVLTSGEVPLAIFLAVIGCAAFYELFTFTSLYSKMSIFVYGVLYLFGLGLVSFYPVFQPILFGLPWSTFICGFSVVSVIFYLVSIYEFRQRRMIQVSFILWHQIKYFVYVFCGFSSIYLVRALPNGGFWILLLFSSIWACDIFAYYGGKTFGKHSLSALSPKKTIEGTLIGVGSAMLLVGCIAFFNGFSMGYAMIAGVIAAGSQVGDLYESLIKRYYNIKDSSQLLPGHGGVLDRSDSSLYVAPIVFFLVYYLVLA